jgi:hypothetical protein
MLKKVFLILLIANCFQLKAQNRGVVIDSIGTPIPYVNIWVDGENIGTTSLEDGTFLLGISGEKTVVFSAVGFETRRTSVKADEKIILKSKIHQLDEVAIYNLKNTKEIEVGDSRKRFYLPEPQTVPWILGRKFSSKEDFKFVKSLIFYTNSEVENAIFRVRIFNIGNDGLPNEDVLSEELLVKVKKGKKKTTVDVLSHKIKIPAEGIIVAFECLLIENNKYIQDAVIGNSKKKVAILNYSPHILYFYDKTAETYNFRAGKWAYFSKEILDIHPNSKMPIPAIDLILTN